jgi:hypothetical protein
MTQSEPSVTIYQATFPPRSGLLEQIGEPELARLSVFHFELCLPYESILVITALLSGVSL